MLPNSTTPTMNISPPGDGKIAVFQQTQIDHRVSLLQFPVNCENESG